MNTKIQKLKEEGKPIVLDLGCGDNKRPGTIGVDKAQLDGVDVIADVDEHLPFDDNRVDAIYTTYLFEHVKDIVKVMEECHRVLKPGGKFHIRVPHATNVGAFDLTNTNFFMYDAFTFFIVGEIHASDFRTSARFRYISRKIVFGKKAFWNYLIEPIVNLIPRVYENTPLRIFPARDLLVTLEAVK